jgi:NADH-quinone oxidoreductase subunit L
MLTPLVILAFLSFTGGWIGIPKALFGGDQFARFLEPVTGSPIHRAGTADHELLFSGISLVVALIGVFIADLIYRRKPAMAGQIAGSAKGLYSLLVNKYWIDQLYQGAIVTPLLFASRYLLGGLVDRGLINGGGTLAAGSVRGVGSLVQRVQSGNIRSYAGWLAIGAAALLLITYFGFSMHL